MRFGDSYATGPPRKGFAFFVPNAELGGDERTYQGNRGLQIAAEQSINLQFRLCSSHPLILALGGFGPRRFPLAESVAPASGSGIQTGAVIP